MANRSLNHFTPGCSVEALCALWAKKLARGFSEFLLEMGENVAHSSIPLAGFVYYASFINHKHYFYKHIFSIVQWRFMSTVGTRTT